MYAVVYYRHSAVGPERIVVIQDRRLWQSLCHVWAGRLDRAFQWPDGTVAPPCCVEDAQGQRVSWDYSRSPLLHCPRQL